MKDQTKWQSWGEAGMFPVDVATIIDKDVGMLAPCKRPSLYTDTYLCRASIRGKSPRGEAIILFGSMYHIYLVLGRGNEFVSVFFTPGAGRRCT